MTRRRLIDMALGTPSERALKGTQGDKQTRLSLVSILRGQVAMLERAELAALNGDERAQRERDRLAEAIRLTAEALRS